MRAPRLGSALTVALGVVALHGCTPADEPGERGIDAAPAAASQEVGPQEARLVFPEETGWLRVEPRTLDLPSERQERIRVLLAALLAGPEETDLAPPLPAAVSLADVFIDHRGIAYLDLHSEEHPDPPGSGSRLELLRVFSVVDTVLLNVEGVRGVVLLWNGAQRSTFAGHVDLTRPLTRDPGLLRGAP